MRIHENTTRVSALKPDRKFKDMAAEKAAEEFEAVFLSQMLQHMFSESKHPEMFGGGSYAEDVYKEMMVDEYGKLLARTGGIGVADYVKRELLTLQEMEVQ